MPARDDRPDWALPRGVDRALWNYTVSDELALSDASYFAGHGLMSRDLDMALARFQGTGSVVDLGCGTGRAALAFARLGCNVTAVDLSHPMLCMTRDLASAEHLQLGCVRANVCHLRCFAEGTFDSALMLFSTLGMIRGRSCRRLALAEAGRVVRAGGRLAVHAHNYWFNRSNSQGRRWLVADIVARFARRVEGGDRPMFYRGVPNLIVHQYRWQELKSDLTASGWCIDEVLALDPDGAWLRGVRSVTRTSGWLIFASRRAVPSPRLARRK